MAGDPVRHQAAPSGSLGELLKGISRGGLPSNESAPLQLSSIDRVELLSALEDRYQVDLSETEFASANSVEALEELIAQPSQGAASFHYPRWPQSWPVRLLRAAVFTVLVRPSLLILGWPQVIGRENLRNVKGPVLVISNHVTFFDPVLILYALPARLRRRLAVSMDGERLESMRRPSPQSGFRQQAAQPACSISRQSLCSMSFPCRDKPVSARVLRSQAI